MKPLVFLLLPAVLAAQSNVSVGINAGSTVVSTIVTTIVEPAGPSVDSMSGASFIGSFLPNPSGPAGGFGKVPTGDIAPAITTQPAASQSLATGAALTLSVTATGTPAPTYQWYRNNRPIRGATSATYTVASAAVSDAGIYSVTADNPAGFVQSNPALVSVVNKSAFTITPSGISIAVSPTSAGTPATGTVNAGANVTLSSTAAGTGLTYQWQYNDQNISGATSASFQITQISSVAGGAFSVEISNSSGVVAVEEAELNVVTNARLANLSVFGLVGTKNQPLSVGFVIGGTGNKQIVIRGVGPTLASTFGMTGVLATPELTLYGPRETVIATNTAWASSGLTNAQFAALGAFPLVAPADTALSESLAPGADTAQVTGVSNATGTALVELYDADTAASPTASLVNVSGSGYVTTGDLQVGSDSTKPIIAGLVIAGTTSETVLIRGIGPGLSFFGVPNALTGTVVTLYDSTGKQITQNSGWNGDTAISAACSMTGAFPMMPGSKDSALLVTLAPGSYTAVVAGASGAAGVGLVEVYEVREPQLYFP